MNSQPADSSSSTVAVDEPLQITEGFVTTTVSRMEVIFEPQQLTPDQASSDSTTTTSAWEAASSPPEQSTAGPSTDGIPIDLVILPESHGTDSEENTDRPATPDYSSSSDNSSLSSASSYEDQPANNPVTEEASMWAEPTSTTEMEAEQLPSKLVFYCGNCAWNSY